MSASSDGGIDNRRRGLDVIPYSQRMHDVLCETDLRGDLSFAFLALNGVILGDLARLRRGARREKPFS
ncbi:hypothetical protein T190_30260 [Sinorhizobium meliloti CCBAU 01290]|nr:hypothetical protein T190_30260 [Sinorhizobium meliloti CCBAU 01290]